MDTQELLGTVAANSIVDSVQGVDSGAVDTCHYRLVSIQTPTPTVLFLSAR